MIFEQGKARTIDLARSLGVSEVTIRTDLEVLEDQGRVSRVHGGATMPEEPLVGFDQRSTQRVEAKQRIAAAAVRLIEDGMTIVLDSGTTSFALARQLPTVTDLVVLTPGVNIALRLMDVAGVDLRLLGGKLMPRIAATVGTARQQGLEGVIAHVAFLGAGGVDADNDIVEGTFDIADSKRTLGAVARRKVLLADASKWTTTDHHKVLNVSDFDTVITDDTMPQAIQDSIRASGCELIVV
ncbi:DeoR family transcriptional regulator [Amnibacterium flavum]|uniref:DeoR family transcriptional regulator n=2 Tax=Amnibacterium flavum TaxID=2173173 RepID=A0A2V1HWV8_9MICO|nr:DeoR family transcriptional regulator [Amnibacterium flavum]